MKNLIACLILLLSLTQEIHGQVRGIQGRIISEDLKTLPQVNIQSSDGVLFGKTDSEGRFRIDVPQSTHKLFFSWVGVEPVSVFLNNNCDTIEVIMMHAVSYDFMLPSKVDKRRLARYKKLPGIFLQAYNNGVFTKDSICYTRKFEPSR
jgi:hypothetical protein